MKANPSAEFSLLDAIGNLGQETKAPKAAVALTPAPPREPLTAVHQIVDSSVVKGRGIVTRMRCGAEASSKDTDGPVGTAWASLMTCLECVAETERMLAGAS